MTTTKTKTPGQIDYEADVAQRPRYHDDTPRLTWDQLPEYAKWSWERDPKLTNQG